MDNWAIIPNTIVEGIEEKCIKNIGKFTIKSLYDDLCDFARDDLQKFDQMLWQFYQAEIDYLLEETLKRALNKRPDNGVYYNKNAKLLDLLCHYAYDRNWTRTLKLFNLGLQDVKWRNPKQNNLSKQVQNEINKIVAEKGDYALVLISKALREIKDEISDEGYITVDVSDISKKENDIVEYKLSTLKSFSALTNAIYYYLVEYIKPYHYGYEWILQDSKTGAVLKSIRMISGIPPGVRMPDLRSIDDVGITKGMHLIAKSLITENKT